MKRPTPIFLLTLIAACATTHTPQRTPVSPPLPATATAYELAGKVELPKAAAEEHKGLHNIFHLSTDIVSGSEPEGDVALKQLADMGIKTILSVDGKEPDHELAAKYGMRYVHVPIRYSGISEDERFAIAKTFRELDGPFYVHCFHGKHRGPAAAALGRVVLDGVSRDEAVAEMRQWCGTSKKYEGLYATIAFGDIPTADATEAFAFDFPNAHRIAGVRHAMIELPRAFDALEALANRDWVVDPDHPDASAGNEAAKLVEVLQQTNRLPDVAEKPADFRGWLAQSEVDARDLAAALKRFEAGDANAGAEAKAAVAKVKASCTDCHAVYRDKQR